MSTVRLAFSAAPQYVRTARLVGAAVARRAGVADDLLHDVRLAIGEACGRAVARHRRHRLDALVHVEMTDDGPYTVRVTDAYDGAGSHNDDEEGDAADQMAETVLAGLVDDLTVDGGEVRMSWPVRRGLAWR
jgi:anti-sigma regulatory factor (Ser/Thr protein kinase)